MYVDALHRAFCVVGEREKESEAVAVVDGG